MNSSVKLTGLSATHLKKLRRISGAEEKSYYIHEAVRHSWSAEELGRAVSRREFQKRQGIGVAPSLADAGRRGRAVGCAHNTLQNDMRFLAQKGR